MKGNSKKVNLCRSCRSKKLYEIINLGNQPLANSLVAKKKITEKKFPLVLIYCNNCNLIQLSHTINPTILFKKYLWVTGTSKKIYQYRKFFFKKINKICSKLNIEKKILEIASNDGFFLEIFNKNKYKSLGIDPAKNLLKVSRKKRVRTLPVFFDGKIHGYLEKEKFLPKVILMRNVVPHSHNINEIFNTLKKIMSNESICAIEFHDSKKIFENLHYDYIYHEHVFYFTLSSIQNILKKFEFQIFDLFKSPISGGSYVILFSKKKYRQSKYLTSELYKDYQFNKIIYKKFKIFKKKIINHKKEVLNFFYENNKSSKICGYGASARSSTMINYCEINRFSNNISIIFDKNKFKSKKYTPGSRIKIEYPKKKIISKFDTIVIFSWNFYKEVLNFLKSIQFKGKIITFLPNLKIKKIKNDNKKNKLRKSF